MGSYTLRLRNSWPAAVAATLLAASFAHAQGAPPDSAAPAATAEPAWHPGGPVPSVDDVMDRLDDLFRGDSAYATLTMEVRTENFERTLELESWSLGDDFALFVIRSPAREAGTASLKTDEGLWNYAPRADRLMRVPSGMMSDGWMGSHITNEDLLRESDYVDDYDTTLSWATVDGGDVLRAVVLPRETAAVVYTRIEYDLTPETWVPLEMRSYDGGDLVRTMRFGDVRDVGGRPVPFRMEVVPAEDPDEYTRMQYGELSFDADVDRALFTPGGLRRAAQTR